MRGRTKPAAEHPFGETLSVAQGSERHAVILRSAYFVVAYFRDRSLNVAQRTQFMHACVSADRSIGPSPPGPLYD